MKIKEIRTRVVEWRGKTVPLPPHFCTNPMDVLAVSEASMGTFTFHGWLVVEIFTDNGLVGIGNAALSPPVTKQVIDLYLKPLLLGADPWDIEFLWQHMYRKTMAFGRKGIAMVAISAVDIALWDLLGKSAKQPVYRLLGGRTKPRIPVYASRLYATPLDELAREAKRYQSEGYKAMKLRYGWGPIDGAAGMQQNVALVRTVRETVGDGVDIMTDAYMGWNLDYAKRMLPLLEPFNLRWLEEAVIPDDIQAYAELRRRTSIPIAGGEHEHTLYGFQQLIEARAVDVIQFDTNRVGGLTQARKIAALAEAHSIPVIPHAGQMHNYHVVMASLNSPMAEFFPPVDVEVGNELFWYIFDGEPKPKDGFIDLDENVPGLGLTINEPALAQFHVTEQEMSQPKIAFLGLGLMGTGMATRLLDAGFPLAVYNRTASRAAPLAAKGARVATSPADAARGANILISMVADDPASRSMWLAESGALSAVSRDTLLIESSTLSVGWVKELAAHAAEKGCELLDAPVTGSKPQAAAGELNFLVGGSDAALARARPALSAMSRDIVHLGPTGSGALVKLINNFVCGVQLVAIAEAVALIERTALDRDKALAVLTNGAPGSPLVKTLSARMTAHQFTPNFLLRLMAKDLGYAIKEGKERSLDLPTAAAALESLNSALREYGDQDMSSIVEFYRAI